MKKQGAFTPTCSPYLIHNPKSNHESLKEAIGKLPVYGKEINKIQKPISKKDISSIKGREGI